MHHLAWMKQPVADLMCTSESNGLGRKLQGYRDAATGSVEKTCGFKSADPITESAKFFAVLESNA